jgi:hypothetical protein
LLRPAFIARAPGGPAERLLAGEEVVFEGRPGLALQPLNDAARRAKALAIVDAPFRRNGAIEASASALALSLDGVPARSADEATEKIGNFLRVYLPADHPRRPKL